MKALLALLLVSGAAHAGPQIWVSTTHHEGDAPLEVTNIHAFVDGNSLWNDCTNSARQQACINYIIGVTDVLMNQNTNSMCLPSNVTQGQIMDVVKKYLRDNPASRHFTGMSEVQVALQEAFPCARTQT